MFRESKVWGERWMIRQDSTHATSYLKLLKGHRCSWHFHVTKFNLFAVLTGRVKITTEEVDGSKHEVTLTEGQSFTVRPEQEHEFEALEESTMIEEMYVEYCEQDIIRKKQGS